jgi:hypothetical protein
LNDDHVMFVYVDMCEKSDASLGHVKSLDLDRVISLRCENSDDCERRVPHRGCRCIQNKCICPGDPPKINQQYQNFIRT